MTDKIVTHEDLRHVATVERIMRRNAGEGVSPGDWAEVVKFVERLRAAAEADQPPLPEGWVLLSDENGCEQTPYWHESGWLFSRRDSVSGIPGAMRAATVRDRLTPLRPTFTAADVEKAARAAHESEYIAAWTDLHEETRSSYAKQVRAALDALDIEVRS